MCQCLHITGRKVALKWVSELYLKYYSCWIVWYQVCREWALFSGMNKHSGSKLKHYVLQEEQILKISRWQNVKTIWYFLRGIISYKCIIKSSCEIKNLDKYSIYCMISSNGRKIETFSLYSNTCVKYPDYKLLFSLLKSVSMFTTTQKTFSL